MKSRYVGLTALLLITVPATSINGYFANSDNAVGPKTVASPDERPEIVILPLGTSIVLSMDRALATDKRVREKGQPKPPKNKRRITNKGDTFTMTVAEDVIQNGQVVIPKGARGFGEVTMVTGRGGFGKSGKIEFKLNYIEIEAGQIPMEGTHLQKGEGKRDMAIIGTLAVGPIVGAFVKGEEADVPFLSEWTFTTAEDVEFKLVEQELLAK